MNDSEGIRKSSRINTQKRSSYLEDDFEYDYGDIGMDISNLLESHSQGEKIKNFSKKKAKEKTFSNGTRRSKKKRGKAKPRSAMSRVCVDRVDLQSDGNATNDATPEKSDDVELPSVSGSVLVNMENLSCPLCSQYISTEEELEVHIDEHRSQDKRLKGCHVCDICDKVCMDTASYNRHLRSHTGERPYKCDHCDKSFTERCSLKRHKQTHKDERPYTCSVCFKSFRDSAGYVRHQKTHTKLPRIFQCSHCGKSFTDKHGLTRHQRTHTGLRPFECGICHKTFSESGSFRRHQKIHTGIRNHQCWRCRRTFLEKQSLTRHQKNVCGFGTAMESSAAFNLQEKNFHANVKNEICDMSSNDSNMNSRNGDSSESVSKNVLDDPKLSGKVNPSLLSLPTPSLAISSKDVAGASILMQVSKESPTLCSLMKKDPKLYDSISEIVDSIDSYEKMLDLCGDSGQTELDAALKREPTPMPKNLLCFECGELLVDGVNFQSAEKTFHPSVSNNSFRCMNCDEAEGAYEESPGLPADEQSEYKYSNLKHFADEETVDGTVNAEDKNCDESVEKLRKLLEIQHGVSFITNSYSKTEEEESDSTCDTSTRGTGSRSNSTDSDGYSMKLAPLSSAVFASAQSRNNRETSLQDMQCENLQQGKNNIPPKSLETLANTINVKQQQQSASWSNSSPRMEYEADDPNIPSVFPCHLCTKVFASSAFLLQHLELHKRSPHKCMVCSKKFTNAASLKRHMRMHTGEKPYSCTCCGKQFRDPSNFCKHKKMCPLLSSVLNPTEDSVSSINSVQSTPSNDDLDLMSTTDLNSSVEKNLYQQSKPRDTEPIKFSYDEDMDLSVSFGHAVESQVESELAVKTEDGQHEAESEGKDFEDFESFSCGLCEKVFGDERTLEMHMNYHYGDPDVTCVECGKSFVDPHGLKRHMRIHAGIRPHMCEYCGRGYCDNWSLKKHRSRGCLFSEVQVPTDLLHPCPQCARVFSESNYLQEHMLTHKGLLKFECDICLKRFSEAFNLKRHRRLHMAVCSGCEREFKNVQALHEHQATECPASAPEPNATGSDTGHMCPECGRVYSTKAYLERHKKFHSNFKPHVCEICSKTFSEAFRLRRHMKIHGGDKPFSCGGCGKGYADKGSMKRHALNSGCNNSKGKQKRKRLAESTMFSCHMCDKVFQKNYLLIRHMNVHSQERPFNCDVCGRAYKDTSSLRRHQTVHQGVKQFICPVCGKDFFYSDSLKRHVTGRCGKKSKARGRKKARRQAKKKANNNEDMKDNNQIPRVKRSTQDKKRTLITEAYSAQSMSESGSAPRGSSSALITRKRAVASGHWSCHRKRHCWRCDLKLDSNRALLVHAGVHTHQKRFKCTKCFLRLSRKMYWKAHTQGHKNAKSGVVTSATNRPRRLKPRVQWSWISRI